MVTDCKHTTICACGHCAGEHQNGGGRCEGYSYDIEYGRYRCLCCYYTTERL